MRSSIVLIGAACLLSSMFANTYRVVNASINQHGFFRVAESEEALGKDSSYSELLQENETLKARLQVQETLHPSNVSASAFHRSSEGVSMESIHEAKIQIEAKAASRASGQRALISSPKPYECNWGTEYPLFNSMLGSEVKKAARPWRWSAQPPPEVCTAMQGLKFTWRYKKPRWGLHALMMYPTHDALNAYCFDATDCKRMLVWTKLSKSLTVTRVSTVLDAYAEVGHFFKNNELHHVVIGGHGSGSSVVLGDKSWPGNACDLPRGVPEKDCPALCLGHVNTLLFFAELVDKMHRNGNIVFLSCHAGTSNENKKWTLRDAQQDETGRTLVPAGKYNMVEYVSAVAKSKGKKLNVIGPVNEIAEIRLHEDDLVGGFSSYAFAMNFADNTGSVVHAG